MTRLTIQAVAVSPALFFLLSYMVGGYQNPGYKFIRQVSSYCGVAVWQVYEVIVLQFYLANLRSEAPGLGSYYFTILSSKILEVH